MARSAAPAFGDDDPFGDAGFDADDDFGFGAPAPARRPASVEDDAFAEVDFAPRAEDILPAAAPPAIAVHPPVNPFAAHAPEETAPGPLGGPVGALIAHAESAMGDALAPRIDIHIFCGRAETAAVAKDAAEDRRLARATTSVLPGGLAEALAHYGNVPTPPLIIVESLDPGPALLAGLDRLAEVCDTGTKVVVIGQANDIALYRELMRRGVSEYLVPPLNTLQLVRTVTGLYADPSTAFVGRTLAFVGAKGGVGASTVAHNVAFAMAEHFGTATCIVDYDLAFGTAGLDFNQDPVQGIADALSKPDRLDAVLIDRMTARCTDKLSLFAAPASLDDDYDISAEAYEEVGQKIRATAPFVILDLPHLWSGWMRKTLLGADEVVIVAAPDLASLRNAKNMVDILKKARPNDAPPRLIINQVGLPGRPEIPIKEFAKALGLEPALVLPFDAKLFGQAANNGQMVYEVNAKAKAAQGLMMFSQALCRKEATGIAAKPKSLLDRLIPR
jgi:pilus assembly protein CpaE